MKKISNALIRICSVENKSMRRGHTVFYVTSNILEYGLPLEAITRSHLVGSSVYKNSNKR